jgi:hypothetical protein
VALGDSYYNCRHEAIKRLADTEQETFRKVAFGDSDSDCRSEAIKRLADTEQETFRKVALDDSSWCRRFQAIKRLADTEQETLKKVAIGDSEYECRREAIKRLNRKNLVEVARRSGFFKKCRIFFRLLKLRFIGDSTPALSGPAKEARLVYEKKEVTPGKMIALEGAFSTHEKSATRAEIYSERKTSLEKQIMELRVLIESAKQERETLIGEDEEPVLAKRLDSHIAGMEKSLSALADVLADLCEVKKEEQEKMDQANAVFERAVRSAKAEKAIIDMESKMRSWGEETTRILTHMKTT